MRLLKFFIIIIIIIIIVIIIIIIIMHSADSVHWSCREQAL